MGREPAEALPFGERRTMAPHRFEVRVDRRGAQWNVLPEDTDALGPFMTLLVALKQARELARILWADTGRPTCVKTLSPEGTWVVDEIYGIDRRRR